MQDKQRAEHMRCPMSKSASERNDVASNAGIHGMPSSLSSEYLAAAQVTVSDMVTPEIEGRYVVLVIKQ